MGATPPTTTTALDGPPADAAPPAGRRIHDVVVIGAGFAGLGAAIRLRQRGFDDVLVLEAADRLGGTWRDNTYPGCACDVASPLYSFSFAPNPGWSRRYGGQAEILAYLEACADRFDVRRSIRFGAQVTRLVWDEDAACWEARLDGGEVVRGRQVIAGTGPLNRPSIPELPGAERFRGPAFHSMTWDHGVDLRGKRVVVVGTGASAIQIVPAIAPQVAALTVFQRTAPWVVPKRDGAVPGWQRGLFRLLAPVLWLYRYLLYWGNEAKAVAFVGGRSMMRVAEALARRHLDRELGDRPALRDAATPRFAMGCKRVLLSNDWYPTLRQDHVRLETASIAEVLPDGVRTDDGRFHPADVLVYATGFRVADDPLPVDVVGPGGRRLLPRWREDGARTYLGLATAGFPNLWFLVGPNTGLGHNSIVFMIECQLRFIVGVLEGLRRRGARRVEVRGDAEDRFAGWLARRMGRTVWLSGCRSWYLDRQGRNVTLWPTYTWVYWLWTRRPRWGALRVGTAEGTAGATSPADAEGSAAAEHQGEVVGGHGVLGLELEPRRSGDGA